MTGRLLNPSEAVLLVVDIQERFVDAINECERVIKRSRIMLEACGKLGIPVIVSEQYPKGLGHTVRELLENLPENTPIFEKTAFGCGADPAIHEALAALGRRQVMVCGIEAHVCVNQTVHQLLQAGYQVHLIQDAISSRSKKDAKTAFKKMHQSGAIPSGVEMAMFELMGNARHERFKELQALIK